jgi:hypothetical protein
MNRLIATRATGPNSERGRRRLHGVLPGRLPDTWVLEIAIIEWIRLVQRLTAARPDQYATRGEPMASSSASLVGSGSMI